MAAQVGPPLRLTLVTVADDGRSAAGTRGRPPPDGRGPVPAPTVGG
ncbi:hypothetical protein [Ornithinimicrobium kibberense]